MKAFNVGDRVKYRDGNAEYSVVGTPDKSRHLPLLGVRNGLYSMSHTDDLIHVGDRASDYSDAQQALLDRVSNLERRVDENVGSINRFCIQIGKLEMGIDGLVKRFNRFAERVSDV